VSSVAVSAVCVSAQRSIGMRRAMIRGPVSELRPSEREQREVRESGCRSDELPVGPEVAA
jgi:hypothetical protein